MHFTSGLKGKSPALGQAKATGLKRGATGKRKSSPDTYCGPEVSRSVIIIAGWEVRCAWQLLFPSACRGWMEESREANSVGPLPPAARGLLRIAAFWIPKSPSRTASPGSMSFSRWEHHLLAKDFSQGHCSTESQDRAVCMEFLSALVKNLGKSQRAASRLDCSWPCTSAVNAHFVCHCKN